MKRSSQMRPAFNLKLNSGLLPLDGAVLCHSPHHLPLPTSFLLKVGFCWFSISLFSFVFFQDLFIHRYFLSSLCGHEYLQLMA